MSTTYNIAHRNAYGGNLTWGNDTIRCALIDDSTTYTPSPESENHVDDVLDGGTTATEFSDSSYSRQTLTISLAGDVTNNQSAQDIEFSADDAVFSNLTGGTVQGALIYKQVGGDDTTPGDDPLVAYVDGADYPASTNGEDFVVDFGDDGSNSNGIVFTVSY